MTEEAPVLPPSRDVIMEPASPPTRTRELSTEAAAPMFSTSIDVNSGKGLHIASESRSVLQSPLPEKHTSKAPSSRSTSPLALRSPPAESHAQLAVLLSKVYTANEGLREDLSRLQAEGLRLQDENTRLQRETPQSELFRKEASDLRSQVSRLNSEVDRLREENSGLKEQASREKIRADAAVRLVDAMDTVASPSDHLQDKQTPPKRTATHPQQSVPSSSNGGQSNSANVLTSGALRTILDCESRAAAAEKQRDEYRDRAKLAEHQRDDAIARVEQIVIGRDDIITRRDGALARLESERIQAIVQRDEAEARRTALTTAWGELERYLELADVRTRDARAGFSRIVAEGGGRLVVLPLGGLNENGDIEMNGRPTDGPSGPRIQHVQLSNGSGSRATGPPTLSPNSMAYTSRRPPTHSSQSTLGPSSSFTHFPSTYPVAPGQASRTAPHTNGVEHSGQRRVRPDGFDESSRPHKRPRGESDPREDSRHGQGREGEVDVRRHNTSRERDEHGHRGERRNSESRRELDNRSQRAVFTASPMPSPHVAHTVAPPTQALSGPYPLSHHDATNGRPRSSHMYPTTRSANAGQALHSTSPEHHRTSRRRRRSGSASSGSSASIDEMLLATATKEERSGGSGSPPPPPPPSDVYSYRPHPQTQYQAPRPGGQIMQMQSTQIVGPHGGSIYVAPGRAYDGHAYNQQPVFTQPLTGPPAKMNPAPQPQMQWDVRTGPPPQRPSPHVGPMAPATAPVEVPKSHPGVNEKGERSCRACGVAGRYKEGKCIEKWGPGPEGPGTVCDRCRKKMKRVEKRGTLEGTQQSGPSNGAQQAYPPSGRAPQATGSQPLQPSPSLPLTTRPYNPGSSSQPLQRATTMDSRSLRRHDTLPYVPAPQSGGLGPEGTHLVLQQAESQGSSRSKSTRRVSTSSGLPPPPPPLGMSREDPPESSMRSTQATHRVALPAPLGQGAAPVDADADGEADEDAEGEDAELLEAVEAAESKANTSGSPPGGEWMKEEDA